MRHNYSIADDNFRLRPVRIEDAAFIVTVRTDPARSQYLHTTSGGISGQEQWIAEYLERPDEYYFVIERLVTCEPTGTIGIYDMDRLTKSAEWGRWVTCPYSRAGAAGLKLLVTLAFDQLGIDTLYCHTIVENAKAIAIFEYLGFERIGLVPNYAHIRGIVYEGLKFRVTRAAWRHAQMAS